MSGNGAAERRGVGLATLREGPDGKIASVA